MSTRHPLLCDVRQSFPGVEVAVGINPVLFFFRELFMFIFFSWNTAQVRRSIRSRSRSMHPRQIRKREIMGGAGTGRKRESGMQAGILPTGPRECLEKHPSHATKRREKKKKLLDIRVDRRDGSRVISQHLPKTTKVPLRDRRILLKKKKKVLATSSYSPGVAQTPVDHVSVHLSPVGRTRQQKQHGNENQNQTKTKNVALTLNALCFHT